MAEDSRRSSTSANLAIAALCAIALAIVVIFLERPTMSDLAAFDWAKNPSPVHKFDVKVPLSSLKSFSGRIETIAANHQLKFRFAKQHPREPKYALDAWAHIAAFSGFNAFEHEVYRFVVHIDKARGGTLDEADRLMKEIIEAATNLPIDQMPIDK
jgi:hypothetical protein